MSCPSCDFLRFAVSRWNGSRDPCRQLARYRATSAVADNSLLLSLNTTCRRHGFSPDRTVSYPLLTDRKPAPTVAGDRRETSVAPGVCSGANEGVGRQQDAPANAPPPFLLTSPLRRRTTASHTSGPSRTMASTSAGRERLSPPIHRNHVK